MGSLDYLLALKGELVSFVSYRIWDCYPSPLVFILSVHLHLSSGLSFYKHVKIIIKTQNVGWVSWYLGYLLSLNCIKEKTLFLKVWKSVSVAQPPIDFFCLFWMLWENASYFLAVELLNVNLECISSAVLLQVAHFQWHLLSSWRNSWNHGYHIRISFS